MAHSGQGFQHSKAMKNSNFPLLRRSIKTAVSYNSSHLARATSQTMRTMPWLFCKLTALLCCGALKCICHKPSTGQTTVMAPLLEPPQSSRPCWGTPAGQDGCGCFEESAAGAVWALQGPAEQLSTAWDTQTQGSPNPWNKPGQSSSVNATTEKSSTQHLMCLCSSCWTLSHEHAARLKQKAAVYAVSTLAVILCP